MPYKTCFNCKTTFYAMNDCADIPKEKILCDGCYNEKHGLSRYQF